MAVIGAMGKLGHSRQAPRYRTFEDETAESRGDTISYIFLPLTPPARIKAMSFRRVLTWTARSDVS